MNEIINFDDKIVIVPVELARDKAVAGDGIALYVVMKSFGPRAEAAIDTYSVRLGWHPETVRKWQRILVEAGWIVLLREGGTQRPRLWWMCRRKNEKPPQAVEVTPQKNQGVEFSTPGKNQGVKKPGCGKFHPKAVEGSSSSRTKRKTERENPGASAPAPSRASPSDPTPQVDPDAEAILSQLDPIRRESPYRRPLARNAENLSAALEAGRVFGAALAPSYWLYLADRSAGLLRISHRLKTWVNQADSWMPTTSNNSAMNNSAISGKCPGPGPHGGATNYCGSNWCRDCYQARESEAHT